MMTDHIETKVKERILNVARDLFIQNGYASTSVRDIATASDTNVAMVSYYFKSKYALFEIIFDEALNVLLNRVFRVVTSDLPFEELVKQWIDSYYETLAEYPQIPIFVINEINLSYGHLAERVRNHQPYQIFLRLSERIEKEVKKGTIRPISPLDFILNVLSLCIFPFIFGKMAVKVADKTHQEYEEILHTHKTHVKEFVLNALRP